MISTPSISSRYSPSPHDALLFSLRSRIRVACSVLPVVVEGVDIGGKRSADEEIGIGFGVESAWVMRMLRLGLMRRGRTRMENSKGLRGGSTCV